MAEAKAEIEYSCSNDCEQGGCPNHIAKVDFHSVSSTLKFDDGVGGEMWFDMNKLEVFLKLLDKISWRVEIDGELQKITKLTNGRCGK